MKKYAILHSEEMILNQVKQMTRYRKVTRADGFILTIEADTLCVNPSHPRAVELINRIREQLR